MLNPPMIVDPTTGELPIRFVHPDAYPPPGADLDALIAKHVLPDVAPGPITPFYSSEIVDAFAVVSHLHNQGWVVELTMRSGTRRYCRIWRMGAQGRGYGALAQTDTTIPHVICIAALYLASHPPPPDYAPSP